MATRTMHRSASPGRPGRASWCSTRRRRPRRSTPNDGRLSTRTRTTMDFSSNYVTCAGREIHFTEWGRDQRGTVVAWHGLARTGRDMDELARALADRYRVICPDTIGRGYSQWSPDPGNEYKLEFYARVAAELFDHLGLARAHWVGTSM